MADNNEVQVGVSLLDFTAGLSAVATSLGTTAGKLREIKDKLDDDAKNEGETYYYGKALEEMQMFINSYEQHVEKLMTFYTNAATYVYNVYDQMDAKDAALSQWVVNQYLLMMQESSGASGAAMGANRGNVSDQASVKN